MSGIVGILNKNNDPIEEDKIRIMNDILTHRGPDDSGLFIDHLIGLGCRKIGIIDQNANHQPMSSANERYTIVFDGEIYNYLELKNELINAGFRFRTQSDTEVLLNWYIYKGKDCIKGINGVFAFAIWDTELQELFIARDRLGIKPFYYFNDGERFVFASEIKAIIADRSIPREPEYTAILDYLHFMYVSDKKTFFKGIYKLLPGHYGVINFVNGLSVSQYWDVEFTESNEIRDEAGIVEELKELLFDAVKLRLRSGGNIGCYLSGGIDSSAVTCLAAKQYPTKINSFSGKFSESVFYDETNYAKIVSNYAKTNYLETSPGEGYYRKVLPKLIWHMDEPSAGPGIIPQYLVCQFASQHVRVVLGGQGGDEIFGGYNRYFLLENPLKQNAWLEKMFFIISFLKNYIYQHGIRKTIQKIVRAILKKSGESSNFEDKWFNNNTILESNHPLITDKFKDKVFGYNSKETYLHFIRNSKIDDDFNKMLYHDLKTYLPALLQVEDRTSMAVSIESRLPLLDHRIIELVANIPVKLKVKDMEPKYILKKAIAGIIPKEIIERTDKKGFPTPIDVWFRKDKQLLMEFLLSNRAIKRGLFERREVIKLINSGYNMNLLWMLINIELWFRIFIDEDNKYIDESGKIKEGVSIF